MSAYPCAGGIYLWTFTLAPHRWRAAAAWMAGWLNLLGHIAFTASLAAALASSVTVQADMWALRDPAALYQATHSISAAGSNARGVSVH